jgi:hypothetical protein
MLLRLASYRFVPIGVYPIFMRVLKQKCLKNLMNIAYRALQTG